MTLQSISKENAIFNAAFLWIRVTSKITFAWPSKAIFLPASATDFLNFLRFLYFYLYCIESVWCSHRRTIWSCTFYSQDNMLKIKAARMTEDKKRNNMKGLSSMWISPELILEYRKMLGFLPCQVVNMEKKDKKL